MILEPLNKRGKPHFRRVRDEYVYVIALEIRLNERNAKRFANLQPRDTERLEDARSNNSSPVLRRKNNVCVQIVNNVGSNAKAIRGNHANNVKRGQKK